ncbi:hypothetical protein JTB14_007744 [Gonioctena quinquepunctata]|nr:hypothetical protein JTB14_007744 [Gonioctena quinquepunctata]
MPKHKKIDKNKAVTFQLVHRSQQDPLVADENAPQRVLLPVEGKVLKKDHEKRVEEQHKYGIFYDDDYNYLEYLKESKDNQMQWPEHVESELEKRIENSKNKIQLPSYVFASEVEEDVGMLGKAAPVSGPQLHLDPDIVAAMDEDFDYSDPENQLEDNFMELANGVSSNKEFSEDEEYFDSDKEGSLTGSEQSFEKEETKSRFTNYSMTSSVIRRNEQLTLLDEKFEKMYAVYEDNEIGALDCEEIEGHVPITSDILLQYADEFKQSQKKEQIDKDVLAGKIKEQLEMSSDEEELVTIIVPNEEKWDCESILSTYSNIYNHPKLIKEPKVDKIRINKKTGIPVNVLDSNKLTTKALNKLNEENGTCGRGGPQSVGGQSIISQLSVLSMRPKDESPKERKERKNLLKEYRKERRLEKKMNTVAFKEEAKRQEKNVICEHITTDDRNQSYKPSNECSLEKENNLLKRIIEEMESKNSILHENCNLLKDKISYLQKQIDYNNPNKNEAIVGHLAGKKGNASSTTKTLSDINCLQTEESGVKTGSADIISPVLVKGNSKGNSQQIKIIEVSRTLLEETTRNKLNDIIHLAENPRQTTPTSTVSEDNTWKTITCRKRKPAKVIVGSNNVNSGNAGAVKGVPKFVDLHVYRVAPDTTKDSMESLLKPNFPESYGKLLTQSNKFILKTSISLTATVEPHSEVVV